MTSIAIDRTDGLSSSTAIKGPVRVATTANISLSGEQTIDGVAVVTGDRVLVRSQTAPSENGIYVADTGPWRRAKDFSRTTDVRTGTQIYVTHGSLYAASGWYVSTANPITIGTTGIVFTQNVLLNGAQLVALEAGDGLVYNPNFTRFVPMSKPWASIEEYLNGSRTDAEALEAALADTKSVWIPKGILNLGTDTITIAGRGQKIVGSGKGLTRIQSSGTGGMFQLGTTSQTWIDGCISDISLEATNGHVLVLPGNLKGAALCHFTRIYMKQNSADKGFVYGEDSVWIDNHIDNFHVEHVANATATGFHFIAPSGSLISSNTFERGRATYSGDYVFHIEHSGDSNSYQFDNVFRAINFEVCRGGCVRLLGIMKARLEDLLLYDCDPSGTVDKAPIYLDKGSHASPPLSRSIIVDGFERRSSTLAAGVYDIKVGSAGGVSDLEIRGGDNASLAGYKVDLNSAPGAIIYGQRNWTVDNKHSSTIAIRSNRGGVTADITFGTDTSLARPGANRLRLTASDETELTGDLNLSVAGKGIQFEDGDKLTAFKTWTAFAPTLTCATPGDLNVVAAATGFYRRVGNCVEGKINISTSTFTHSSAAGQVRIDGLPVAANFASGSFARPVVRYQGVTKANYTTFMASPVNGQTHLLLLASGSGQPLSTLAITDLPTGGTVVLDVEFSYPV